MNALSVYLMCFYYSIFLKDLLGRNMTFNNKKEMILQYILLKIMGKVFSFYC